MPALFTSTSSSGSSGQRRVHRRLVGDVELHDVGAERSHRVAAAGSRMPA